MVIGICTVHKGHSNDSGSPLCYPKCSMAKTLSLNVELILFLEMVLIVLCTSPHIPTLNWDVNIVGKGVSILINR